MGTNYNSVLYVDVFGAPYPTPQQARAVLSLGSRRREDLTLRSSRLLACFAS